MILLHFENERELLGYLSTYRDYYYELIEIEHEIGIHSPALKSDGGAGHSSKISQYNRNIERRNEIESYMSDIVSVVEKLHHVDNISYVIMYHKFIRMMSLEDISSMMHYSMSSVAHKYYPEAKKKLLELCK